MKRHASSCSEKSRRIDPQVKVKRHASSEWGSAMGPSEWGEPPASVWRLIPPEGPGLSCASPVGPREVSLQLGLGLRWGFLRLEPL